MALRNPTIVNNRSRREPTCQSVVRYFTNSPENSLMKRGGALKNIPLLTNHHKSLLCVSFFSRQLKNIDDMLAYLCRNYTKPLTGWRKESCIICSFKMGYTCYKEGRKGSMTIYSVHVTLEVQENKQSLWDEYSVTSLFVLGHCFQII